MRGAYAVGALLGGLTVACGEASSAQRVDAAGHDASGSVGGSAGVSADAASDTNVSEANGDAVSDAPVGDATSDAPAGDATSDAQSGDATSDVQAGDATGDVNTADAAVPLPVEHPAYPGPPLLWPVRRSAAERRISSAFGPRLKASDNFRYDFHRGIDIPGTSGEDVIAVADGVVTKIAVEGSVSAPEGGNTVYLQHALSAPVSFHGQSVDRFYSVSMHLSAFAPGLTVGQSVKQGDVIGALGQSGTTVFDHVHFEIRLGTQCSLEWQLANPTSSCAVGYDPHVNPTQYLFADDAAPPELVVHPASAGVLTVDLGAPTPAADFDSLVVRLDDAQGTSVIAATLALDARTGLDPTSIATLDQATLGVFTLRPAKLDQTSTRWAMSVDVALPASATPLRGSVRAEDVWGNGVTVTVP